MSEVGTLQDSAGAHGYGLPKGTLLQEFRIEKVLGHGGFGITYLARDTSHDDEAVAIKEYLPAELAMRVSNSTVRARSPDDQKMFNDGVFSFLEEARRIARVVHPNIMAVKKFFTMNGTAYIVLQYERGETVKQRAERPMGEKVVRSILDGVLQGLIAIHSHGSALLHRDIKPANIILSRSRSDHELTPVLIDFGAAREFRNRNSRSVTALISQGFSPPEQYGAGGQQGPWSDIYALGATAYRCVTGEAPPDSLTRLGTDAMVPAAVKAKGHYSDDLLRLIDWMMMIKEADRPRSAAEVLQALRSSSGPAENPPAARVDISADGPKHFVVQIPNPPDGSSHGFAFKVTPPGQYLGPAAGRLQSKPHYFDLIRVVGEQGQVGFRGGPDLRARLRRGTRVQLVSQDGNTDATLQWPLSSGASSGFSTRFLAILAASLVAFVVAALNIGTIQDTICDKTGWCTAQQVLFRTARDCAQRASACGVGACLAGYRSKGTLPRLLDKATAMETAAMQLCRSEDATAYQQAKSCADQKRSSRICDVDACYSTYRSGFPNGEHLREARTDAEAARQACQLAASVPQRPQSPPPAAGAAPTPTPTPTRQPPPAAAPAPTPAPAPSPAPAPAPTPAPAPSAALPDGTYMAVRTFVEAKSQSDPASCPPSTNIQVTVQGNVIRFENHESNTGITRKWKGTVLPDGKIAFLGSDASPPTTNYLTILGDYRSAEITSKFCGKGYFKITR